MTCSGALKVWLSRIASRIGQLRLADLVAGEIERHFLVVARDREDLLEDRLQTGLLALAQGDIRLQKLDVGVRAGLR